MILLDYIGFTTEKNKKASQQNPVVMWDGIHQELNDIVRLQRVSCNKNLVVMWEIQPMNYLWVVSLT